MWIYSNLALVEFYTKSIHIMRGPGVYIYFFVSVFYKKLKGMREEKFLGHVRISDKVSKWSRYAVDIHVNCEILSVFSIEPSKKKINIPLNYLIDYSVL